MHPVIIIEEEPHVVRKARLVEVLKAGVYKDVDLVTHKYVEGNDKIIQSTAYKTVALSLAASNERSSDTTEDVDGAIIARSVQYADARLRTRLQAFLAEESVESANSRIGVETKFIYNLRLPESVPDAILKAIAEHIHRFLVRCALVDWFGQFGLLQEAEWYERGLQLLEEKVVSSVRGSSLAKRPMQPFGPATKMPR